MTTHPGALPLATNPRFAAQLRLLRALTAMRRAKAAAEESRRLVAHSRERWARTDDAGASKATRDDGPVLRLL